MGKIFIFMKKRWWWLVIIGVIILAAYKLSTPPETTYVTAAVERGSITQTVEVTGQVESADEIDLNFKSGGIIQSIGVKVGDEVKAGQTLASLRAGDISAQINDAQAAVDIARSELDKLLAGASDEDIQVTQEELRAAEISYNSAVDALAGLENTRNQELNNLYVTGVNTAKDKYFVAQYALEIINDSLLDTNADSNLLTSDSQALINAENRYDLAMIDFNGLSSAVSGLNQGSDQAEILNTLDSLEALLNDISQTLSYGFQVFQAARASGTYTQSVIDTWKTTINTQSTTVNTAISSVRDASSDIRTRDIYYQNQITDANNDIQSALTSLNLAKAKLNYKTADPRDFDIKSAEANVRRAQANLSRILSQFSDTIIKAPVDGLITKVNFDPGESSSITTPVISMIGLTNLQIEVNVPESDITKIALADQVDIVLDALNIESAIAGTVTFIDPAATVINDVIYYKIKVNFVDKNDQIKSGMTADLTILTDKKDDVLIIPARAVIYKENKRIVQILQADNQVVDQEVVTGIKGDDGMIEIIEGLTQGQQVITLTSNGK